MIRLNMRMLFLIIFLVCLTGISSRAYASSSVLYYKDSLCFGIIYDEAGNDTGKVEVGFPECDLVIGHEGLSEPTIIVPDSIDIRGKRYEVTRVANYGFKSLSSLESITLPVSVTEIGEYAFKDCSQLSNIIAGCDSIEVGANAFEDSYWMELQQDDFVALNNTVIEYRGNDSNVIIPSNIKTIGAYAFSSSNIKSVSFPDSIEKIGPAAFNMCENLSSITIPGSVKIIDAAAFSSCPKLNKIQLSEGLEIIKERAFENAGVSSIEFPDSLKTIDYAAFSGCTKLVDIKLNNGLKEIGICAFSYNKSMKKIVIPKSVEIIHEEAFDSCYSLTSVILSDGVKTIKERAFNDCDKLKKVVIPPSVSYLAYSAFSDKALEKKMKGEFCIINNMLVKYSGKSKVAKIPKGVKKILCTFNNNPNLKQVIFPSSLNEIGPYAFSGCKLEEITIPGTVLKIGDYAFSGGLKKVTIENGVKEIGEGAFSSNELTTIMIPKSVLSIGNQVFTYNDKLASIKFNEGLEYIGNWAFRDCNLKELTLPSTVKILGGLAAEGGNDNLSSISFSKSMSNTSLLSRGEISKVTKITLQEGIKAVSNLSIYPKLRRIELPKSLVTIHAGTFYQSGIETIYIPDGTNYIGNAAFQDCVRLREVSIPDSVKYIRRGAFWGSRSVVFRCNENSVAYEFAMDAGIKVVGPYVKK